MGRTNGRTPENTSVKVLGHSVHQMLVIFPPGLLVAAVAFDAVDLFGGAAVFGEVAFWNVTAGLAGAVAAAVFGWLDWFGIPAGTRARQIGLVHGLVNGLLMVLFAAAWVVRLGADERGVGVVWFAVEVVAVGLLAFSGWLGGELVDRLGIGVDRGAHPDAPSSLSGRPADEHSSART
jgi:uncharacterized membrane protein